MKNQVLFWLGFSHLIIFAILLIYYPFNSKMVLGINSVIKPMKFALSIWIYSWTMSLILDFVEDKSKVHIYSWAAVVSMCFEQIAITSQALRGELSHFNNSSVYGIVLFALMGVFILTITLWSAYITYIFIKQEKYNLSPSIALSIKVGLIYFVVFSLFGGYISSLPGHTVGESDGGKGLLFLNWSTFYGDLRVAHFFGIHSLQIIPLFAILFDKLFRINDALIATKLFSILYFCFILGSLLQSLMGLPFIGG